MEEAEMTVEASVPDWDNSLELKPPMNALFISERGGLQERAFGLSDRMTVKYFQRLPGDNPFLFPEDSPLQYIVSWRPHVAWADMIVVDDPTFVSRMAVDFKLDDLMLMYMIDNGSYEETGRLINWLNPLTLGTLKDAMENIDTPAVVDIASEGVGFWKRLFRRSRG